MATERDLEFQPYEQTLQLLVDRLREIMVVSWRNAPGLMRRLGQANLSPNDLNTPADLEAARELIGTKVATVSALREGERSLRHFFASAAVHEQRAR